MPNRVLRDWTASEKIDSLSIGAEVFFVRLIMKADDFGLYPANHKFLRSTLFPLKEISESDVLTWLNECMVSGVIKLYKHEGKQYLQILNFEQRLRLQKAKYPMPDECLTNDGQLTDNGRPETKRNEVETETKPKGNEPDFQLFDKWSKDIIDGNDFYFSQKFQNEFPNWGGGPEKFVEVVNDHFDMLNRYPKMNPNTQERFRNSVIKHFREYEGKANGTGTKKGLDLNAERELIANHIKGGQRQ